MTKIATKLGTVSAKDMYQSFVDQLLKDKPLFKARIWKNIPRGEIYDDKGNTYITYNQYKAILSAYNKKAADRLIKGYTLDLMNGLGNLFAARVERGAKNTRLNIAASLKLKKRYEEEGKLTKDNWKVPYTDDDFMGIIWHKGNGLLNNISLYKFKTAGGQPGKGFRQHFSKFIQNNEYIKGIYPYLPSKALSYIEYKQEKNGI